VVTSKDPITPANFKDAAAVPGATGPLAPGSDESISLPAHERYLAVRAVDDAGNIGPTSIIDTGATVVPDPDPDPGPGPGPGTGTKPPKVVEPGVGYFYKGKLYLRVLCPKRFKPACQYRATVVTKKKNGKPMSKTVRLKVPSAKSKRVVLKVKKAFLARVEKFAGVNRRTIYLRLKVKAKRATHGPRKTTIYHHLRVRKP
jgi:hypothetical protein